jgi:hypothetical protein
MGAKLYRFKWTNIDFNEYRSGRLRQAQKMKDEAAVFIARANEIESEISILEEALLEEKEESKGEPEP